VVFSILELREDSPDSESEDISMISLLPRASLSTGDCEGTDVVCKREVPKAESCCSIAEGCKQESSIGEIVCWEYCKSIIYSKLVAGSYK